MILNFNVNQQTVVLMKTSSVPRIGSKEYLALQFSFSSDWENLEKLVYLQKGDVSESISIVDGKVEVPEWFTEQDSFNVTLFGTDGTTEVPTNVVSVQLEKSNVLWQKDAPEPQQSWLVVALESAEKAKASEDAAKVFETNAANSASSAQESAESASTSAFNASVSATTAAKSETSAIEAKTASETAKTEAGKSASAAKESETASKASETAAAESATVAQSAQSGAEAAQAAAAKSAQDAADVAATLGSLPDDITQLKQDITAITPDDTTVDGKPWTSKKIVDSLCQPIEESGNPVQCYPVENYPLGVKVNWEPVQEGSGDPSPDNIRPIKGRDSVKVERCGENLLNIKPFNKFTKKGITFEYIPDGGIHMSGTATANADGPVFPVWHLPPGKYYGINTVAKVNASIVVVRNGSNLWLSTKGVFEILAGDICRYWYMNVNDGETVDETVFPYIVPGTTAPTTYEPYTGDTYNIALPETVYGGELDAVSGESSRTWRTITLTGEESSYVYSQFFYLDLSKDSSFVPEAPVDTTTGKSSHYRYRTYAAGCIGVAKHGGTVLYDSNGKYPVSNEGLQEWKSYLAAQYAAGTPVQICYKLAEPVPFTATGTQPIPVLSGVNTLYTDADGVIVTGAEDPKHTITELKNAIISLGGNV